MIFLLRSLLSLHLEPQAALCLRGSRVDRPSHQRTSFFIKFTSRSIVTDWILELPENKDDLKKEWTITVVNERFDYLVRDVYHSFRGNTLKFSVNAEYMPIVGFFFKVTPTQIRKDYLS